MRFVAERQVNFNMLVEGDNRKYFDRRGQYVWWLDFIPPLLRENSNVTAISLQFVKSDDIPAKSSKGAFECFFRGPLVIIVSEIVPHF